jgi:hypothetical protein
VDIQKECRNHGNTWTEEGSENYMWRNFIIVLLKKNMKWIRISGMTKAEHTVYIGEMANQSLEGKSIGKKYSLYPR